MNICRLGSVFLMGAFGAATSWGQVVDDFTDGNDDGWTRSNPLATVGGTAAFSFPGGNTYRIQAFGPGRVGSLREDVDNTAFRVSVDIVEAAAALEQDFGILARVSTPGLGTLNGYAATFDSDEERVYLSRVDNEQAVTLGNVDVSVEEGKAYRLVFHGYQGQFLVEVFDVADLTTTIATVEGFDDFYINGSAGLFGNAGQADGAVDVTFDNFEAHEDPDTDRDGMSDPAEAAVFGDLEQKGEDDFDGDGRSNAEELEGGTDPKVADTVIKVRSFLISEDVLQVRFALLQGRTFQLEKSVDLENWSVDEEAVFTDLGDGVGEFESVRSGGKEFVRVSGVDAG
jgi:hypothetical protein